MSRGARRSQSDVQLCLWISRHAQETPELRSENNLHEKDIAGSFVSTARAPAVATSHNKNFLPGALANGGGTAATTTSSSSSSLDMSDTSKAIITIPKSMKIATKNMTTLSVAMVLFHTGIQIPWGTFANPDWLCPAKVWSSQAAAVIDVSALGEDVKLQLPVSLDGCAVRRCSWQPACASGRMALSAGGGGVPTAVLEIRPPWKSACPASNAMARTA
mmetsp:Transcript_131806/g.239653  ORF Transcript_131806/g.239653 Transcript_131806/m.239653 type:complete len:218 (-) Transcript_131806:145-798(-)